MTCPRWFCLSTLSMQQDDNDLVPLDAISEMSDLDKKPSSKTSRLAPSYIANAAVVDRAAREAINRTASTISLAALADEPDHIALPRFHRYIGRHEPRLEDYNKQKPSDRYRCWSRQRDYEWGTFIYLSRSFLSLVFRMITVLTIAIAVTSTVLCYEFKLATDLPLSIIGTALFFPISFGINWTFNRRENVLQTVADIKSNALALYWCCRDWQRPESIVHLQMKHALTLLLSEMNTYLMHAGTPLMEIYKAFERIDRILDRTLTEAEWIRSVMSRAYQYQRYMLLDFEKLRVIHDYRTPSALRAYGLFFLTLTPALLGPLFAKYSTEYGYWAGIYVAIVVAVMMAGLYSIQMDQEDPFDGAGVDDLNMHVLDEPPFYMWEKQKTSQPEWMRPPPPQPPNPYDHHHTPAPSSSSSHHSTRASGIHVVPPPHSSSAHSHQQSHAHAQPHVHVQLQPPHTQPHPQPEAPKPSVSTNAPKRNISAKILEGPGSADDSD